MNPYNNRDLYFVAVKVFLENRGKLFIFKDKYGDWDLPGGRIQKREFRTPLKKITDRKTKEELGRLVRYKLGKPVVFMRHERREMGIPGQPKVRIFAIGYEARFCGGKIDLSSQHVEYHWVPIKNFKPEKYFKGGWLEGVRNYLRFK